MDLGEPKDLVRAYMKEMGLTFPALLDRDYRVGNMYGVRATPSRFLIDREGNAVAMGIGPQDWFSVEARGLIRSLLDLPATAGGDR